MTTSRILQRLYSLGTSSPDFLRHLYLLIQRDEKEQYLTSLQGSELVRLVDFLDEVRAVLAVFYQFTKRTSQALDVIPTTDNVARETLHKLQAICGHQVTLPSSYIISDEIARVGDSPIILGDIVDVWEGNYRGKKVSIKSLRIHMKNYQTLKKVRIWCCTSSSCLLKHIRGSCSHSSKTPLPGKG